MKKSRWRPEDRKPKALYSTAKSGYARDIVPDRMQPEERTGIAIPVASVTGRQEGRPAPAERVYGSNTHEVVDVGEALSRMTARAQGKLPPIRGGLDDYGRPKQARKTADWVPLEPEPQRAPPPASDNEFDNNGEDESGMDVFSPGPVDRPAQPVRQNVTQPKRYSIPVDVGGEWADAMTKVDDYLKQRRRVTVELPDTTLSLSAIDVVFNRYGVTLILPMNSDGGTFIPKPGSQVTINVDEKSVECYFPGAYFELPKLKMLGLMFIRAEEETHG